MQSVYRMAAICAVILFITSSWLCASSLDYVFSCPNLSTPICGSTNDSRTPVYFLVMVPFADERPQAGLDYGLTMLPGARIARDYINCERKDLLPGYRVELIETSSEPCGVSESYEEAYLNLLRFAYYKECTGGPVVAVIGLICSQTTAAVSPLAGKQLNLVQLSLSSSPIFDLKPAKYPRLWRFVSSGLAYIDKMVKLINVMGWTRIGLIDNNSNLYYSQIAKNFKNTIKKGGVNFTLSFSVQLDARSKQRGLDHAMKAFKQSNSTIIFVIANYYQSAYLACEGARSGLIYPIYQWVFVDMLISDFHAQGVCPNNTLWPILLHGIFLTYSSPTFQLGRLGINYTHQYAAAFKQVLVDFRVSQDIVHVHGHNYDYVMFDQVWGFANVLNRSISDLRQGNLTLTDYIPQSPTSTTIANVIEEQLSLINIQGFLSIGFRDRYIQTQIVMTFFCNGTNITTTSVDITNIQSCDFPADLRKPKQIMPHYGLVAVLYLVVLITLIIITIIDAFFIYHLRHPLVKASSPYLRMFITAGSYLICLSALLHITGEGLGGRVIVGTTYELLCAGEIVLDYYGLGLILSALFIIQLRIKFIFKNKHLNHLSSCWKNSTLGIIITGMSLVMFSVSVLLMSLPVQQFRPSYTTSQVRFPNTINQTGVLVESYALYCNSQSSLAVIAILVALLLFYVVAISYLAIILRNVRYVQFKESKEINIFMCVLFITVVVSLATGILMFATNMLTYLLIVRVVLNLAVAIACQCILFVPKIIPVVFNKTFIIK